MDGKISKPGFLSIYRKSKWKPQYCPFSVVGDSDNFTQENCGDWCPHFGEPEGGTTDDNFDKTAITICHGKELVFTSFEDER